MTPKMVGDGGGEWERRWHRSLMSNTQEEQHILECPRRDILEAGGTTEHLSHARHCAQGSMITEPGSAFPKHSPPLLLPLSPARVALTIPH